jgi:DNA-binding NarL/FixJ family response regulator
VSSTAGQTTTPRSDTGAATGIAVLDDLSVVRDGVRHTLSGVPGLRLIAEGPVDDNAVDLVVASGVSLVLVDLGTADRPTAELVRALGRRAPGVSVVVYTMSTDMELLWESLEAGGRGYILKDTPRDTLIAALQTVADGRTYVDERMAPDVLRQQPRPRKTGVLSERERQILQMLADGASNNDVSEHLVVSIETVKTHVKHILAKLEAKHRTQAVAIGLRQGIIR